MFSSLRNRLTLIFIGLAVVPLMVTTFIVGLRNFRILGDEAIAFQRNKAELVSNEVNSFIRQRENELRVLANVRGLSGMDTEEHLITLNNLLSEERSYQELALLGPDGQETARVSRLDIFTDANLVDRSQEEYFLKPVATGETYFSPVRFDEEMSEPLLTLSIPIIDPVTGKPEAVLVADVRFKAIWDLFGTLEFTDDEDIFMVDSTGRVVAHRNPSVVLRGTSFMPPAEDGRTTGLDNDDVILATNTIQFGEQSFTIVAEQSYQQASEMARGTIRVTSATLVIALAAAVVLVYGTVRQIVTPVEHLSKTAEQIGKGDLSQRAQVKSQDEIGKLASSFNAMTDQLQTTLENERMSRLFLEKSQAVARTGSYRFDIKNDSWMSSPMLDEIFGIDDDFTKDIEGWLSVIHPDQREELRQYFNEHVLEKHDRFDKEYRVVCHNDQQECWVYDQGELEFDEHGNPVMMVGIVQDITERKRSEEAMELLRYSVDHASIGIIQTGDKGQILSVNQRYCELIGYSREELCNMHTYDLDPDFPQERWKEHRAHIREHGSDTFETVHQRKDGTTIPVEITATYVLFEGSEFSFTFVHDITERKQMLEALYLSNFAVERTADAVYWIDKAANITDVNEAACRMTGYSREELIGMSVVAIDARQTPDQVNINLKQIEKEGSLAFETYHKTKEGHTFPVEVVVSHISHEGRELYCAFARDITERKQMLEALRLNSFAVEQSSDAVFWVDEDAVITDVNEAACRMTGYSREEHIGLSVADIDPTKTLDEVKAVWERIKEEGSLAFETQHKAKDGRIFPVEVVVSHISHDGKEFNCAFSRDITERKRSEEIIKESQAILNATLESIQDGLLVITGEGIVKHYNSKFSQMWAIPEELLEARNDMSLIDYVLHQLANPEQFVTRILEVYQTSDIIEDILQLKDGRFFERISYPLIQDGQENGRVWMSRDITESKQMEEALRQSETQFRTLVENAPSGIFLINDTYQFIYSNEELHTILGYSADELNGMDFRNVLTEESRSIVEDRYVRRQRGEAVPSRYELDVVHKDGSVRQLEMTAAAFEYFDKGVRTIGQVIDITERKQTEEALRLNSFALEHTSDAVYWVSATTIVDVNESACQMLGYSREEFRNMPVTTIDPVMSEPEIVKIWEQIKKEGAQTFETQHKTKDGRLISVEIMVNYIEFEGQELGCCFVRDITERKQAEEALRLSNFALERTSDAVYWINLTTIMDVNEAACRMLGYSREELCGMPVTNIDPSMPEADMVNAWEYVKKEGAITFETQHKTKDGRLIPMEIMANYIAFEGQELNCCFARDITERKQAEEALLLNNFALERASNAVHWVDSDGRIFDVNEAACRMLGYSREEMIGMSLKDIDPVFDFTNWPAEWKDIKAGKVAPLETLHRAKDGRLIPVEVMANYVEFEGKEFNCSFARDITERKRTEEALRQSEARYRALIESQIDLMSRYRPDTTLTFVNDAYCQFYGKTREELIGNSYLTMIAPEFRELVRQETESLVTNPRVISGEYLNYAADGRECWIHWVIKTIADENGQVVEMQAVGRDVTEIKQAEEKIRQLNEELEQRVIERTRELEEANEEIRNFAYIVSHDLRAPLVNLKGFASELRLNLGDVMDGFEGLLPSVEPARQDRMRRALQEDIPEALRFIESSVSNMDTFTKAILKLSRLGRLHLELVEVDVKEMVEKTLDSLAYQIDQQGIEVNVGDLPVITADFVSMEQVFGNILTNAVMYCDPDRPGKIEISAEQRSADTVFRIQDNGRGIAKEDMDKVFTPFRRAGEQDMPGEGMGLAYVQALVRRHGGRIWCESEPGVGTTFTFTIAKNLKEDNIMP